MLTLIREVESRVYRYTTKNNKKYTHTKRYAVYLCSCGKQKEIRMLDVKRGHTKTCGKC